MKKIFIIAAAAVGLMTANAQQAVEHTNFGDNWSIGLTGGVTTPLKNHAFFGNMRGTFGLDLHKQISYVFGVGAEGVAAINTSSWDNAIRSNTVIDQSYVGAYANVNLTNLFMGYSCDARKFGIDAVAGAGWLHTYWAKSQAPDWNDFATKVGLNINYTPTPAVTLSLRPSIMWNMTGNDVAQTNAAYDVHSATFNLALGVMFNFGNGFPCVTCPNDLSGEVAELNGRVNALRGELANATALAQQNDARARALAAELEACKNRPVQTNTVVNNNLNSVRYVFFKIGSSVITKDQQPNVEMIAAYLKNHKDSKVIIKGYASKVGNYENNVKLANNRAQAVKNALVNTYKINADRITAEGEGIGEMFSEESWNQVSICTVED